MRSLVLAPYRGGKTEYLLQKAWELQTEGVLWLSLPTQRQSILYRLSQQPNLNIQVSNLSSVVYSILELAHHNKRLLSIPARTALLGRILMEYKKTPPTTGEASLYQAAIAELKRSHNTHILPCFADDYTRDLSEMFNRYQTLLQEHQAIDLDDARDIATEALVSGKVRLAARHVIVDGYLEFNPSELALLQALAAQSPSMQVSLAYGQSPQVYRVNSEHVAHYARVLDAKTITLNPKIPIRHTVHSYANRTSEVRGVIAQVKTALLNGEKSQHLAIIVPTLSYAKDAFSLGFESRIPLSNFAPQNPLELPEGKLLSTLLSTRRRKYPVRDLLELASLYPGLETIAHELEKRQLNGIHYPLANADAGSLKRLMFDTTPPGAGMKAWEDWIAQLLSRTAYPEPEALLLLAREVYQLIPTEQPSEVLIQWFQGLLPQVEMFVRPPSGVAILTPEQASNLQFKTVWVLGVNENHYRLNESEDFFFNEELRAELKLPLRLRGVFDSMFSDVSFRGNEVILSYPLAERSGSLRPHHMLGLFPEAVHVQSPTASTLEYLFATRDALPPPAKMWWNNVGSITETDLDRLAHYLPCKLRGYLAHLNPRDEHFGLLGSDTLLKLQKQMRHAKWNSGDFELDLPFSDDFKDLLRQELARKIPEKPALPELRLNKPMQVGEYRFRPHAYQHLKDTVHLYIVGANDGYAFIQRHPQYAFAVHLLKQQGYKPEINLWDLTTKPKKYNLTPKTQLRHVENFLALIAELKQGNVQPTAGFHCYGCAFKQICKL